MTLNSKKNKKRVASSLLINNKAFILPTVTIFIMLLISFSMWQTYNNLDFMYVTNQFNNSIVLQVAYEQVNNEVLNAIENKDNSICTLNTYPLQTTSTLDYEISIWYTCLRKPLATQIIPASSKSLRNMFQKLQTNNGEVTKSQYQTIKEDMLAIEALEYREEIIGPWIGIDDFERSLLELGLAPELIAEQVATEVLRRAEIDKMQRYLIFDCRIKVQELEKQIMYIYNADTNEMENKIVA